MKSRWNYTLKDGDKEIKIEGRYFSTLDIPYLFETAEIEPNNNFDFDKKFQLIWSFRQDAVLETIMDRCVKNEVDINFEDLDQDEIGDIIEKATELFVNQITKNMKKLIKQKENQENQENKQAMFEEDIGAEEAQSFLPEEQN